MDCEEQLINEVRLHPNLWDKRSESYKNRSKTDEVWDNMAKTLTESKESLKSRWKNLLDVFQKELKKIPEPRLGEQGSPSSVNYSGDWPHFHDMWFLSDVMIPRATQHNNAEDQDEQAQSNIQDKSTSQSSEESAVQPICQGTVSSIQEHIEVRDSSLGDSELLDISERTAQKPSSSKTATSRKRKAAPSDLTEFQERMLQIEQKKIIAFHEEHSDPVTPDDDDTHFLTTLAPYLKPLNPVAKLRLRSKIENLIAVENACTSTVSSSSTDILPSPVLSRYTGHPTSSTQFSSLVVDTVSQQWRTRSLNAPSPVQQFGPCGRIMKNSSMVMIIQDPASQRLTWYKPPLTVLVIKKVRDANVYMPFVQLVHWLIQEKRMVVFVEASVMDDTNLDQYKTFTKIKDSLMTFRDGKDDLTDKIDFIICLGGDGTLLYASQLFQQSVPPVMAFHLGSLGFLTPFQFDNFQEQVNNVLEGHAALTLRSRLRCIVMKNSDQNNSGDKMKTSNAPKNFLVLNEVVIDRGPSPYLSNIDLFLGGKHITSVQGDGLIVSTPTGSTAYAVAAGASMIHPSVPAIMVTPICPHSLSFRPIVVPAGVELKISVSPDSRNTSWVSFDGRNRQELLHGDSLRVTTSVYPVPSICAQDQISDWFDSLAECLHWNVRKRQKHLDELTDLTHSSSNDTLDSLDRELLEKEEKS